MTMNLEPSLNRGREIVIGVPEGTGSCGRGENDKKHLVRKEGGIIFQLLMIRQTHVEVERFALIYISITKIRQEGS